MRKAALFVVPTLALAPAPASGGELFPHISAAIERLEARWGNRNYASVIGWGILAVNRGNEARGNITARNYGRVTAVGACDRDCNSVRVRVTDYRGAQIAVSDGYGGSAAVSFDPQLGQTYRVHVQPLDCSTPYCYVAWSAVR